jgi:ubiquinone/menaquinone biosynthesis C-methylase UbiE
MLTVAGALAITIGFMISFYTSETQPATAELGLLVGPAVGFLILVVAAALFWSSRLGKVREMEKLVLDIPWGGDEVVLDLGCGRGLAMVLAAKKLTTGFAVGVDTWSRAHLSGNDPKSIKANAEANHVGSRVSAVKAQGAKLPLSNSTVDVVLAGVSVHRLVPKKDRPILFAEMKRVLKDGGRIGVLDAGNGTEYSRIMREGGLTDIEMHRLRFSSFPPFHMVLARKPYGE